MNPKLPADRVADVNVAEQPVLSPSTISDLFGRVYERHVEISSDLREYVNVQNEILARVIDCGFTEHEIFGIHLALEEALVNAIKHGNGADPHKKVFVDYSICECGVRIRITDQGAGFNPNRVADPTSPECIDRPCGRGILLIRHYMNVVQFSEQGNSLEMWLRRSTIPTSDDFADVDTVAARAVEETMNDLTCPSPKVHEPASNAHAANRD
jgi:serine/threonine-protein kinase RsbW